MLIRSLTLLSFLFLVGCAPKTTQESGCFLVVLVEARQLDTTNTQNFFRSVAKHPSDGSKNGDVGHAWIYLQNDSFSIEGGHSGETGEFQPKYFDGVLELAECGDPNPIRYLWETQQDGFFQNGNGGHQPTCAIRIDLNEEQFQDILNLIKNYDFHSYAITGSQCGTFVCEAAALAGIDVECCQTMSICRYVKLGGQKYTLWEDSSYSEITFASPDIIQYSCKELLHKREVTDALTWYKTKHPISFKSRLLNFQETLVNLPYRLARLKYVMN